MGPTSRDSASERLPKRTIRRSNLDVAQLACTMPNPDARSEMLMSRASEMGDRHRRENLATAAMLDQIGPSQSVEIGEVRISTDTR